jgi:hypothetical protein
VIFRHPCAVTESVLKTEMINHSLDEVLDKRQIPFFSRYPSYHSKLKRALELINFKDLFDPLSNNQEDFTKIRKGKLFMIRWVLNNGFLIDQVKNGEINPLIIFYENLLLQPELELKRIIDYLSLKKLNSARIEKDSNSSQSINIHDHKDIHLSKWQNNLSPELIDYIFNLLDIFDIDIYDQNVKPAKNLY